MTGIISLWYGTLTNIPIGWTLCDGTLGTPNLNAVMVPHRGPTFILGTTGGGRTHDHLFIGIGHGHFFLGGVVLGVGPPFHFFLRPTPVSGTSSRDNHEPPWHALAFIQKI